MYNDFDKQNENVSSPNFEELKKSAYRTANWRERLLAIEELGKWKDKEAIYILKKVVQNDVVYKVKEAAYQQLHKLGVEVPLPIKAKGDLIKGVTKILLRIKKSLPEGHTIEEFKEKLQNTRADIYDAYEGEKGAEFDLWLTSEWSSLLTK